MKAVKLGKPGGLDRLHIVDLDEPDAPATGEILVRLHASSLNYHDYDVASGRRPTADGCIPMSDGAGVVETVGQRPQGLIVGSRQEQMDMVRALDAIGLKPVIDRTFALHDIAEAFRFEESGAHFGKICLEI